MSLRSCRSSSVFSFSLNFCRKIWREFSWEFCETQKNLAHQNRTIAIASDFRVDRAKSPEIPQKEGVLGSEIADRLRLSIAPLNRNAALLCLVSEIAAISGVCDGHCNRKSQKSLRFQCAKQKNKGSKISGKISKLFFGGGGGGGVSKAGCL